MKRLPMTAILLACLCNILFGSAIPAIKLGYDLFNMDGDMFSSILYAGIRFFLAGVVVFIFASLYEKKLPSFKRQNAAGVFLLGFVYIFLQYLFFYIGVSNVPGTVSTLLTSSSVFISIILAHFIYKNDKINLRKAVGSIIGFTGVFIVCISGLSGKGFTITGEGFVFVSSFMFVVGSMINKKVTKDISCYVATAYNFLIGGFLLILVGLLGYKGGIEVTVWGCAALLYLIFVSSVATTLWSTLLKKYPIGDLSIFNFLIPVSGAILSGVLLKENIFNLKYMTSLLLVCSGIIAVNFRVKQNTKRESQ